MKTMKKFILMSIAMIFFVGMSYAQTSDVDNVNVNQQISEYVTDSNVEKLVDKYTQQFEAAIISLANALKQPAEYVYRILVKQQYVKAAAGLLIFILLISCIVTAIKFSRNVKDWDDGKVYEGKNTSSAGLTIIFGIISVIMIIVFFAGPFFNNIMQGFINPEYGAIMEIFKLFK